MSILIALISLYSTATMHSKKLYLGSVQDGFSYCTHTHIGTDDVDASPLMYQGGIGGGFAFNSYAQVSESVPGLSAVPPLMAVYQGGSGGGFAYACVGSIGNEVPLPIELIDFSAIVHDNTVVLKWETASTLNNDYFTVERSPDGYNFEIVENIQGVGTSSMVLKYTTIDRHPYEGISYYRLKQTDFDGKYTYSHIEAVNFGDTHIPDIVIYPNPTHNRVAIMGSEIKVEKLEIFNTLGQDMSPFVNIHNYGRQNIVIDLSALPSSIYLIKVGKTTFSIYKE